MARPRPTSRASTSPTSRRRPLAQGEDLSRPVVGISAGQGATCSFGTRGQIVAQRQTADRPGFEGGQIPLYRRLPKFVGRNTDEGRATRRPSTASSSSTC